MTTVKEVVAVAELQAFGVTLFPDLLVELAETKDESLPPSVPRGEYSYLDLGPTPERLVGLCQSDPLSKQPFDARRDYTQVDLLANDGKALDQAVEGDEASRKRLEYAIRFFIEAEERAKAIIEGFMQG
jgi:transaldolase